MKIKIALLTFLFAVNILNISGQTYMPVLIPKCPVTDTFFNKYAVTDDYRCFEDVNNPRLKQWLDEEKKMSKKFLWKVAANTNALKFIEKYNTNNNKYWTKKGKYFFRLMYYHINGTYALYYKTSFNGKYEILVDPNFISSSDKIVLNDYALSHDNKYLAYSYSRNGSDWAEIGVVYMEHGEQMKDHLTGVKFSEIQWLNDGFFYSTFEQKDYFGASMHERVYYHKVGTKQSEDKLIFERKNFPERTFNYITTHNDRYFFLWEEIGDDRYNIFYIDYRSPFKTIRPFLPNVSKYFSIIDDVGDGIIARTSYLEDNGAIYKFKPDDPFHPVVLVPPYSEALLYKVKVFAGRILALYKAGNIPIVSIYDYNGKMLKSYTMPLATTVGGFDGAFNDKEIYYYYTGFTTPLIVFKLNLSTLQKELLDITKVTYDFRTIKTKEVKYKADDGTKIPMIIVYDKELKLDGKNPVILKAYGGFGTLTNPYFDPGVIYYIKHGGIFAYAEIRGGGEKGKEWFFEGRGKNKQQSFDDFNAAAKFLIEKKYTNSELLCATGASNGGLVVAAAVIQHPELYGMAVPIAGPYDMIRFEKFTIGHFHADEYGSTKIRTGFVNLLHYSPYHNIKPDVNYPAMLVVVSEYDDRVPPFHGYKFVAKLQNNSFQSNPVILKLIKNAGHYGSFHWLSVLKDKADIYGFIYYMQKKRLTKPKISRL